VIVAGRETAMVTGDREVWAAVDGVASVGSDDAGLYTGGGGTIGVEADAEARSATVTTIPAMTILTAV
jgi:hypothetical protein